MHLLSLSVAAHTPDSLRFAGPILVIGRGKERREEDCMVGVCEITIPLLLAALHSKSFRKKGGRRNLRSGSTLVHDVQ